jgi:hypothetical protein
MIAARRFSLWIFIAAVTSAASAQAPPAPPRPRDTTYACTSCRFRASANAYTAAAVRVTGAWHDYYAAMAAYEACMATSIAANAGRCGELPRQPAGSPCNAPSDKGIALCNATIPPEQSGAEFVALPDSLASIDLRQAAFTSAGSVRYVWDALKAREELKPSRRARDSVATKRRRHTADSLLDALQAQAEPPPFEQHASKIALDAGIAQLNHAALSDDADEYIDALRFIAFADSLHPSPESKFVLGLITYQIGEHALLAAWEIHNCSVVLLASDAIMKSDRYLSQNSIVAPENAMKLRRSLVLMQKDATELVTRRCL